MHAHALLKFGGDRGSVAGRDGVGGGREAPPRKRGAARLVAAGRAAVDVVTVERMVRETWQATTGAYVVEVAALVSPGAALGYLALHHRKPSQAPPEAWRGMSERASRGYWSRPIAQLRDQARRELAVEAFAHRTGLPRELAELELELRGPSHVIDTAKRDGSELRAPLVGWRP
jgi:hypothetical protein